MNTKIIVALVLGIALVGLTGAAAAFEFDEYGRLITSNTDITGTHFSSVSQTIVSGMPVSSHYTQSFEAEMVVPGYTPDFSKTNLNLVGTDYSMRNSIRSSPTQNTVSTIIGTPSDVMGRITRQNCALQGQGIELETVILPQPISVPSASLWQGEHPAGFAYPAYSREHHSIYWP